MHHLFHLFDLGLSESEGQRPDILTDSPPLEPPKEIQTYHRYSPSRRR